MRGLSMNKKLSEREQEILDYMLQGLTNAEIADRACIKTETVKAHLKSIYQKLNVKNRIQAAIYAIKNSTLIY